MKGKSFLKEYGGQREGRGDKEGWVGIWVIEVSSLKLQCINHYKSDHSKRDWLILYRRFISLTIPKRN